MLELADDQNPALADKPADKLSATLRTVCDKCMPKVEAHNKRQPMHWWSTVCSDRARQPCAQNYRYVRVKKVEAVSMVARATDFSSSEFENSEMLENLL